MISTIERLQYLWAVAESGSFSAAARRLGVSAAAVQQTIQHYEFDLDATLFERSPGKRPTLTVLGKQIYLQALDVIPKLEGIERYAATVRDGQEPQLRIALHGLTLFPAYQRQLRLLQERFPTLELILLDAESAVLSSDKTRLANAPYIDAADITIAPGRLRSDHGGNDQIIERIRWRVVAAPSHPLARRRGVLSSEDVTAYSQLFPQSGLVFTEALSEGIRLSNRLIRYNRFYQLRELLLAGVGFAFYPAQLAEPLFEAGLLQPLTLEFDDQQMNWPVELCWVNGLGAAGQWLVEQLCESSENL